MRVLFTLVAMLVLSGCATNHVAKFYESRIPAEVAANLEKHVMPYSGTSQVFSTQDPRKDADRLMSRGYNLIGVSSFQGAASVTHQQITEQAKKVSADIVLFFSKYEGSGQAVLPYLQFNPATISTTTTSGRVDARASNPTVALNATANYRGTTTTTTSGTLSTRMIPVTVDRYQYEASFWRKARPQILGVRTVPIPDVLRRKLKRNAGAMVNLVADASPAFYANVLVGDVIVSIDSDAVASPEQLLDVIEKKRGMAVVVTLIRDQAEEKIEIQLN